MASHSFDNIPMRHKLPKTWIIVANSEEAHIYCKTVNRLAVITHTTNDMPISNENGARQNRGHIFSPASTVYYCSNPQDRHKSTKLHSFVQNLSALVKKAFTDKLFENLIIIAPSALLGEIRNQMDETILNRVTAELDKNLIHFSEQELYDYLDNLFWI